MSRQKFTEAETATALADLPGWSVEAGKLHRVFRFADFTQAFAFMAMSACGIEKMNHHPEWSNVYGTITVDLTTHDAGGITERDVKLASLLNENARQFKPAS